MNVPIGLAAAVEQGWLGKKEDSFNHALVVEIIMFFPVHKKTHTSRYERGSESFFINCILNTQATYRRTLNGCIMHYAIAYQCSVVSHQVSDHLPGRYHLTLTFFKKN